MLLLSSPTFYRVFGECSRDELFYAHTVGLGFAKRVRKVARKKLAILAKHAVFFGCFNLSVMSCLLRGLLETVPNAKIKHRIIWCFKNPESPGWESGLASYKLAPFFPL